MTNDDLRDQLPALAMNALPPEEEREVRALLQAHPALRAELADMLDTAPFLAAGCRQAEPPSHLWTRIARGLGAAAEAIVTLPNRTAVGVASAAAVAFVVLSGLTYSTQQGVIQARRQLPASYQALGLVARPSARFVSLTGAGSGYVRLVHDVTIRKGALIVSDMRDPGHEKVYQVWLRDDDHRHSPGVFRPERGQLMVMPFDADCHRSRIISITIEARSQGVDKSTHPPVMAGRF